MLPPTVLIWGCDTLAASRCRSDRSLFARRYEFESRYRNRVNKHSRLVGWANARFYNIPDGCRGIGLNNNEQHQMEAATEKQFKFDDLHSVPMDGPEDRTEEPTRTIQKILRQVQRELCLIKLCWPDISIITEDLYVQSLPDTYHCVSEKERLLLWYAENFRRQIQAKYANRRPLLLACENECRVQVGKIWSGQSYVDPQLIISNGL